MVTKQAFFLKMKDIFEKSPVASNTVFSFILLGLEKFVEMEFACPCNPKWNGVFAAAFFVVPAVLVYLLMIIIQGCKGERCSIEWWENVIPHVVPAIFWLIIMFLDGQYFACARTSWSGTFVFVPGSSHQKWCKSDNQTSTKEFLEKTQFWYSVSQMIGIVLVILLIIILFVYAICECEKGKNVQESSTPQVMEATSVSVNIKDRGYAVNFELQPLSQ